MLIGFYFIIIIILYFHNASPIEIMRKGAGLPGGVGTYRIVPIISDECQIGSSSILLACFLVIASVLWCETAELLRSLRKTASLLIQYIRSKHDCTWWQCNILQRLYCNISYKPMLNNTVLHCNCAIIMSSVKQTYFV